MAMLTVGGVTVQVAIDGGFSRDIESLEDIGRAVGGSLLITQLSSTAGAVKEKVTCRTIPLDDATKNTLYGTLLAAATMPVTFDGAFVYDVHPVLRSLTPVTLPGPTRRWVVTFDLIQV